MLPKCVDVMAILNFQPYSIWSELQCRNEGHTWNLILRQEDNMLLIWILRLKDPDCCFIS